MLWVSYASHNQLLVLVEMCSSDCTGTSRYTVHAHLVACSNSASFIVHTQCLISLVDLIDMQLITGMVFIEMFAGRYYTRDFILWVRVVKISGLYLVIKALVCKLKADKYFTPHTACTIL